MNDFYQRFGGLVRSKRLELALSQDRLAEIAKLSRGTIMNVEKGKFAVQAENGLSLISILGIKSADIQAIHLEAKLKEEMAAYRPEIAEFITSVLASSP